MICEKLFIEITFEDISNKILHRLEGIVRLDKVGEVNFEIIRNPQNQSFLQMRVRNKYISCVAFPFADQFFSFDYENRRIIKWIGEHARDMILMNFERNPTNAIGS